MQSIKKLLKATINVALIISLYVSSPIIMDHARDIYMVNVVAPKANPVIVPNYGILGSSFQLSYEGVTVTVSNHHVCDIARVLKKQRDLDGLNYFVNSLRRRGFKYETVMKVYKKGLEKINKTKYTAVGERLKIGNMYRKILHMSKTHDLCFLEATGGPSFKLARSVELGERISIIGHPRGFPQSITDGRIVSRVISSFSWIPDAGKVEILRSTAITYPGNSGSPVVNRYGNVVGVLFAGISIDYINLNGIVPLKYIRAEFKSFMRK